MTEFRTSSCNKQLTISKLVGLELTQEKKDVASKCARNLLKERLLVDLSSYPLKELEDFVWQAIIKGDNQLFLSSNCCDLASCPQRVYQGFLVKALLEETVEES